MNLPTRIPDDPSGLTRGSLFDRGTYWANRSQEFFDALKKQPTNAQLRKDFEHAEKMRREGYERAREKWEREQEREAADAWLEEMAGAPGFELY